MVNNRLFKFKRLSVDDSCSTEEEREKPLAKRIERYGSLPQPTIQGKIISSSIGVKTW